MTGYLYKELKQNRLYILLTAILVPVIIFLPLAVVMAEEKTMAKESFLSFANNGMALRIIFALAGFVAAYIIQTLTLKGDDKKMWGYFVASNPKGINGFVVTKYLFIAAMCLFFFVLGIGFDLAFTFITNYIGGISVPLMTEALFAMMFLMLLFNAVEIPFTIRFGEKRGSIIKTIIGIGIVIIALLAFFINPAGVSDVVNDFLFNGKIPSLMKWILPVGAVISYIISCAVSCKLYMKGVINSYK